MEFVAGDEKVTRRLKLSHELKKEKKRLPEDQALCNFGKYLQRTVFHTPFHADPSSLREMGGNQIGNLILCKDPFK